MPGSRLRWNEWITFGVKYCDLSPDAWVSISVVGSQGPRLVKTLGTARLALFSEVRQLRTGVTKLLLALDGSSTISVTHGAGVNAPDARGGGVAPSATGVTAMQTDDEREIVRLEELCSRHEAATSQPDPSLDWLNRPTYAHLEQRQQEIGRRLERHFVSVQLPEFEYPVLFHEKVAALTPPLGPPAATPRSASGREGAFGGAAGLHDVPGGPVLLSDMEQHRDNPALHKHHKLARSLLSAGFAKELKPDHSELCRLKVLVQYPPTTRLREEEQELLWKFRYSLTKEKRALTKLLKCVDWADAREVHQAHTLLEQWAEADMQDLLELLGRSFVGAASWVREFAVAALRDRATDAQLLSYLLPLVQAVQYERNLQQPPAECPLAALLVQRALKNVELANFFHWYLQVERCDERHGSHFAHVHDEFLRRLDASSSSLSFALRQQESFIGLLSNAAQVLKQSSVPRPKKIQRLQAMFDPSDTLGPLRNLATPLLMPLDPTKRIIASDVSRALVFKSKMQPLGLSFETAEVSPPAATMAPAAPSLYSLIFKSGDDLRQDQLVLQMLIVMDQLLKDKGLDLKLTTYRVLATGPSQGLVERIPSVSITTILEENGGRTDAIKRHLEKLRQGPDGAKVMETFIRSCAGYCVAMYLLGVGDRHMDNLMLCEDGALFHIDFGFILGRDPKPMPPKVRLTKEIVEAMGGADSESYKKFRRFCSEAFNYLREPHASNLILNLLLLMVDGGVAHLNSEQDVMFVAERFCPNMTTEEAAAHFQDVITASVNALMPRLMEGVHTMAQAMRA